MIRIEWLLARKEETVLNVFKLKSMLRENDTLAILMNGSPDPDAVASAMALREILNQTKPLARCAFVATEPVTRYQNAEFIQEMRLAATVKWYEMHKVSQSKAAEIAGISRQAFIEALARFQVSPFQMTPEDLLQEVNRE